MNLQNLVNFRPEYISGFTTISFPVAIVEGNCQLVHGMKGSEFAMFPVCY